MSLDNFQLPVSLLTELYNNSIVALETTQAIPKSLNSTDIPYLGKNRKNILIIVNEPDTPFLNEKDMEFLTGILTACKLNFNDVALVNECHSNNFEVKDLITKFEPRQVLCFGDLLKDWPFEEKKHFDILSHNGYQILFSPSLNNLEKNIEIKKALWNCLKKIFTL